ncbi:NADH:ubiquinone reductase (Na(+)-transporting) subunit F [Luteimonas sp. 22616]|uniref:NADH:ubiquinone reductase (Na(+)-transporting) subunit F n=1 Tax=Luteimonas sp. 22616 TaxID=3453951 RepID=UPI003F853DE6
MTPWIRKLHKWIGLAVALQFTVWLGSGLTMSLLDKDAVENVHHRAPAGDKRDWPGSAVSPAVVLAAATRPVQVIETHWLGDRPVYRLSDKDGSWLASVDDGQPVPVTADVVAAIAAADYVGEARALPPEFMDEAIWEARGHAGPLWRVAFSDGDGTTLYLSGQDGSILERRSSMWRIFDFAMMLHFMDYTRQQDFNNPLIVMAGAGGLWIALSGIWLLVTSFRLGEFIPSRWRPRHELTVFAAGGARLRSVESHSGDTVYLALGRNGLQLPSNCGGGQSCGLCEVRVRGDAPTPTSADREHLDKSRLGLGYRLACNVPVRADLQVEVAGGAALWTERTATVANVVAVTPFLREIVLEPDAALAPSEFQPGAYLQVHVPGYSLQRHEIDHPDDHRPDWAALDLPPTLTCREPVRRSYSLSLPVEKAGGKVTLLARFSPGGRGKKRQPAGKGSTYLYSLKPGDRVHFSGPFGDFALKPGAKEKVFIGGGAGMAPLRAMIHSLLDRNASERIHFWYGARNLREVPYAGEMAELANNHPNFSWHLVLSDAAEHGAGLIQGLVHEATHEGLLQGHPDLQACEFYLCGPPAMLSATRSLLDRLGVGQAQVAFDDFKI